MPKSETLSNRQQRALAEMGIDVWIRRSRGAAVQTLMAAAPVAEPVTTPPVPQFSAECRPDAAPSVQLECLAAPGVVLVGTFTSANDRRFARDILVTVAGAEAAPVQTQFRWPQTMTGDTSLAGARSAYLGFLRGQTDRAGARCLLLFGAAAAALGSSIIPRNECTVARFADVAALRGDAAGKKALWLTISHLVRG